MSLLLLNCHNCGAPAPADSAECAHCHSVLATISCPECLRLMFNGAKFCPHCGAAGSRAEHGATGAACPGCGEELHRNTIGSYCLSECPACHGLWLDVATLNVITTQAEKGTLPDGPIGSITAGTPLEDRVRYKKCPDCLQLMHRANFAKCSGVITDSCRNHGVWFEQGELQRIVLFIKGGGLAKAREREKEDIVQARRLLEAARPLPSAQYHNPSSAQELDITGSWALDFLWALVKAAVSRRDS